ncbi:MAG: hypothetical protein CMM48_15775 [Rhodospirillaceae bacterium]|nr:hypothetical protein [Rhodospirillaceae bacterium]MBL25343.1 hypothetical protein [Rhodospirillaceae bacterium]HAA92710.1 hypothetical protein [Rhodospirillaceae bacterium]|tara:strand:- start:259 stop:1083 length:825 start_codon:yes stop_codon:yes gene_type:complete
MPDVTPFYLWGTAKSGKTWLKQLLCGHPAVAGLDEPHLTDKLLPSIKDSYDKYKTEYKHSKTSNLLNIDDEIINIYKSIIKNMSVNISGDVPIRWLGDDTPETIYVSDFCRAAFPEARFILVLRDGRDAMAASWYAECQKQPELTLQLCPSVEAYAPAYAKAWCYVIETATSFGTEYPKYFHILRYEDLVTSPVETVRTALEFLGESLSPSDIENAFDDYGLRREEDKWCRPVPEDKNWAKLGEVGYWRENLSADAVAAFNEVAGGPLSKMGYA